MEVTLGLQQNNPELRKLYHYKDDDALVFEGEKFLSSSQVKDLLSKTFSSRTKAMDMGNDLHRMMEDIFTYGDHTVVCASHKRNSKGYKAEEEELEASHKHKKFGFSLVPNSEYEKLEHHRHQLMNWRFLRLKGEMRYHSEPVALAQLTAENLVELPGKASKTLAAWLLTGRKQQNVKAMIDLLFMHQDGTVSIHDWKTTSMSSLPAISYQVHELQYVLQLMYYRMVLEACGYRVRPVATLHFLPAAVGMGIVTLNVNLDDEGMVEKYITLPLSQDSRAVLENVRSSMVKGLEWDYVLDERRYGIAVENTDSVEL